MRGARAAAGTVLGAALLLWPALECRAGSDEEAEAPEPRPHRSAEILLSMDDAVPTDREQGGSFRIRKRYGFEYAHRFDRGAGAPMIFSVQGPALPYKRFGLTFEFRF